jgi:hypothetical protein
MRKTDNGAESLNGRGYQLPADGPLPDLGTYERLIAAGLAAADRHGTIVDHVTARRLAIWLAACSQPASLADGLVHFIRTGAISQDLKIQLRKHARSPESVGQAHAARLLHYAIGRSTQLTPVGPGFARACDQMDHADLLLGSLHDQAARGTAPPGRPGRTPMAPR